MGALNKPIILAVLIIALVALMATASAKSVTYNSVTFTVDKITRNGHYVGVPTLVNSDVHKYGYNYTFVFDGSYTVYGHAINTAYKPISAAADLLAYDTHDYEVVSFTVPSAKTDNNPGRADFSLTVKSQTSNFDTWVYLPGAVPDHMVLYKAHELDSDIVDAEDMTQHTVDEGPMSDSIAVYENGKMTYKGAPQYSIGLY